MTTENHEAWLLHKRPSGDSSTQVTFFTREQGILHCLYRGGRTPKRQAALQVFTRLWVAVDSRNDWHYVRSLENVSASMALSGLSLFAGLYLNELLFHTLAPSDSHSGLFDRYYRTLQGLSISNNRLAIEALLRQFEVALLAACGYFLELGQDADSGRFIEEQACYHFIAGKGLVRAEKGLSGKDILSFARGRLDDVQVLKTAKLIMRQAIDHMLGGRELKSRTLFLGVQKLKS
ncbi:DNA repair protein RecO [Legionella spiritensis]|uniref:DNA repair protein RecO n=1 Tax=Legionella spiritensis TaxID=452 RepID=A0A0W0Z6W7_LEGSP|nr:DNA repair protein RecO [Legionella spiritensis]KTD64865.1 DNA repair protein RecO [Legionella spiritensis]SNV40980.1 DNA repair protein RecO [Legionella spiritensis]VEG90509.1 DNA repair protein RecO [Legionella spiritensis]